MFRYDDGFPLAFPESQGFPQVGNGCRIQIGGWLIQYQYLRILDSNDPKDNSAAARTFAAERGLDIQEVRVRISNTLGQLMKRLLDGGLEATLMCTGGDTLLALMRAVDVTELTPVGELATGVVLTYFVYHGKTYYIISKSGGFGEPDLLCRLAERTTGTKEKEDVSCL